MVTETHAPASLRRELGQLGFGAIALNGTIGAGIFALPAAAMAQTSLFSPWLFVICGVLIMALVLSSARAASFVADTGGPATYTQIAFGPFVGFQVGWLLTLSRATAFAANTHLVVTYAAWFWPPLADGMPHVTAVILIYAVLAGLNVIGLRRGMAALFAFSLLKLVPLVLLVLLGLSHTNPAIFGGAPLPSFDTLGESALLLFYAFMGFETALIPAGEARDPRRDIPLALVRTVLAITLFYFLIQLVVVSVIPDAGDTRTPLADVALVLLGTTGASIMTAAAVFSIGGNLSQSLLSAPRMLYAMAHHGNMPQWLAQVHPRWHTPANAITFYAIASLLLALSDGFLVLAVISTVVRMLVYVLCILSLPLLQRKVGEMHNQFRLPGGPVIPLAGLTLSGWLLSYASAQAWLYTLGFIGLGCLIYASRWLGRLRNAARG